MCVQSIQSRVAIRSREGIQLHSALEPQYGKKMDLLELITGLEFLSCEERLRWLSLFSLEKRRCQSDFIAVFHYLMEACKKRGDKLFSRVCYIWRRSDGFKLKR